MVGNANANGVPFIKNGTSFLKDNIVLWYDLKRQGATNETMKANPILKDLSDNGHDATCYNFAWNSASGIGLYPVSDFTFNGVIPDNQSWRAICNVNTYIKQSFKVLINCKGHEGKHVNIIAAYQDNDTGDIRSRVINNDVIIGQVCTVPILELNDNEESLYFDMNPYNGEEVSIQAVPEYPNALVADGVDDYAYVEGLPILTDYTVIAKRKRLDADLTNRGGLASKMAGNTNNGAFLFEFIQANTGIKQVVSFGTFNNIQMVDTDTSYMTKKSYNGTKIGAGTLLDTEYLNLFKVRNQKGGCAQAALYSFILFNRTLTDEEINWVKHNLIEGDTEL